MAVLKIRSLTSNMLSVQEIIKDLVVASSPKFVSPSFGSVKLKSYKIKLKLKKIVATILKQIKHLVFHKLNQWKDQLFMCIEYMCWPALEIYILFGCVNLWCNVTQEYWSLREGNGSKSFSVTKTLGKKSIVYSHKHLRWCGTTFWVRNTQRKEREFKQVTFLGMERLPALGWQLTGMLVSSSHMYPATPFLHLRVL